MYKKIKSPTDLSGFYIAYYGSTMNEHKGIYGISHIMEHLICKGFDDLMKDFEFDGISWNAYTSDNVIVFYMTGLDNYVKKWKKTFYERISNFNITEEQFQNEKKIVLEEYKDSFNEQNECHRQNLLRKLYGYYEAIGLGEDLENLTLDDCYYFFDIQYQKPSMIVDISKGNSKKLDEFFNNISYNNNTYEDVDLEFNDGSYIIEKGNDFKSKTSIINISQIIQEDFPYIKFICRMLGGGLKSPLYQEIRENHGLVYFLNCYQRDITNSSSLIFIETLTSNDNVDKVQELIETILSDPDKYLTRERFDIIKKYYSIKYKKENIMLHNSGYKFIELDKYSIENVLERLTYEKIREIYDKYFDFGLFYKSIDKEEFNEDL